MIQVVALFEHGKTVVNGMRRRQPAALEADAAQIGIRLNDALHRFRHHAGLDRQFGFHPFRQQRVITQPRGLSAASVDLPPAMLVARASKQARASK